jgi:hypothetical protein
MNQSYVQFQIQNLRAMNTQRVMEAIMVTFIATITMIVLPQLLMQYVYASAQLLEVPKAVEYTPFVCYGIAAVYVLFVIITNIGRAKKIKQLEQDLAFSVGSDSDMDLGVDEAELKELEKMVDDAISSQGSKKSTPRKVAPKKRK